METVNVFVDEWRGDGTASVAFLQSFAMYPKVMHEVLLACFILIVNGAHSVSFRDVELSAAWFATLWALIGTGSIAFLVHRYCRPAAAATAILIVGLSGYMLMYANFPRHNIASHALCWIALVVFLLRRPRERYFTRTLALVLGILFTLSIPTHYTAFYALAAVGILEAGFLAIDRRVRASIPNYAVALAIPLVSWLLLDFYYYLYVWLFPGQVNWTGEVIGETAHAKSFFAGLYDYLVHLWGRKMDFKMDGPHWWFILGFWYRTFGPVGTCLLVAGHVFTGAAAIRGFRGGDSEGGRMFSAVCALHVLAFMVSLEYFQNARKLAVFYPIWTLSIAMAIDAVLAAATRENSRAWGYLKKIGNPAVLTVLVLLGVHLLTYGLAAVEIYRGRRDVGYMREALARRGIDRILVLNAWVEAPMAPKQREMRSWPQERAVSVAEAATYDYVVVHRVWPRQFGQAFVDCVRRFQPLESFYNQAKSPIFWYEFPLKTAFWDPTDPLMHSRSLYKRGDVIGVCGEQLDRRYLDESSPE